MNPQKTRGITEKAYTNTNKKEEENKKSVTLRRVVQGRFAERYLTISGVTAASNIRR